MQYKIKKTQHKSILGLVFFIFLFSFVFSFTAQAQNECTTCPPKDSVRLQVYLPMEGVCSCEVPGQVVEDGAVKPGTKTVYFIKDIPTYVKGIYSLLIGIVALGAIIVIMLGGFQYVWAAGNPGKISSAKGMISGALGGLVLALLSYGLLNTINPELVNLKISPAQKIRKIERALYCDEVTGAIEPVGCDPEKETCTFPPIFNEIPRNNSDPTSLTYELTLEDTTCGYPFFIKAGAGNTCFGQQCEQVGGEKEKQCINGTCQEATIYGEYDFEDGKYLDNDLDLWAVCGNTGLVGGDYNLVEVLPTDIEDYTTRGKYAIAGKRRPLIECNDPEKPPKYFLLAEVNDEGGSDDTWMLVSTPQSGGTCYQPIVMCNKGGKQTVVRDNVCDGGTLIPEPGGMNLDVLYNQNTRPLWTHEQIVEGNIKCDLHFSEEFFPEDFGVQITDCPERGEGASAPFVRNDSDMTEDQFDDATTNLTNLINILDESVHFKLNSISDMGLFRTNGNINPLWGECKAWDENWDYQSNPKCIHMNPSQHYGGPFTYIDNNGVTHQNPTRVQEDTSPPAPIPPNTTTRTHSTGFSCAIDIGTVPGSEWSYGCMGQELTKLKNEGIIPLTNRYNGGWLFEGDHIHVEVMGCN